MIRINPLIMDKIDDGDYPSKFKQFLKDILILEYDIEESGFTKNTIDNGYSRLIEKYADLKEIHDFISEYKNE